MQIGPENDRFQFMGNSVYGPFSLFGVFRSESVVFYYNSIVLHLSPEEFSITLNYYFNKSNHSISISPPHTPPKKTVKTKTAVWTPCQQFTFRAIHDLIITNLLHGYLSAESGFKQRRNKNQPRSKSFETESRQSTKCQSCRLLFRLQSTIVFP